MAEEKRWKEKEEELEGIPISSTDSIPGKEVKEYKGYVWGTSVKSKSFADDVSAFIRTLIGGEVSVYTRTINEEKQEVIHRLVENARDLGANAVIGVEMGSTRIAGGAIEIFAFGTAVKVE